MCPFPTLELFHQNPRREKSIRPFKGIAGFVVRPKDSVLHYSRSIALDSYLSNESATTNCCSKSVLLLTVPFASMTTSLQELSKHLSRMEENVDDLERAIKVIATIPEAKPDLDEQPEEQSLDQQKQEEEPFPRPSSGESSAEPTDRLSKMLKNVLQAKVS